MTVIPVNFSSQSNYVLGHTKMLLEGGLMTIHPQRFDKLITSLRTAVENNGKLDKEATSYDDIFNAFRLSELYMFLLYLM
jgi:hypothetical protein